jgi:hypothetical protein
VLWQFYPLSTPNGDLFLEEVEASSSDGNLPAFMEVQGVEFRLDEDCGEYYYGHGGLTAEVPHPIRGFAMDRVVLKHRQPLDAGVKPGLYSEPDIRATVENTLTNNDAPVQYIRVVGQTFADAHEYFIRLVRGEKEPSEPLSSPVSMSNQPSFLQVLDALQQVRRIARNACTRGVVQEGRELAGDMVDIDRILGSLSGAEQSGVDLDSVRSLVHRLQGVPGMGTSRTLRQLCRELGIEQS